MPTYPGTLVSKLPQVGTTIFTVMSRLAAEHNAINLSQGFPDFDCAPELQDLVTKYMKAGLNQYPPMAGIAAIPLSAFYQSPPGHKVLRFCFAKTEQTLFKGTEILRRI